MKTLFHQPCWGKRSKQVRGVQQKKNCWLDRDRYRKPISKYKAVVRWIIKVYYMYVENISIKSCSSRVLKESNIWGLGNNLNGIISILYIL